MDFIDKKSEANLKDDTVKEFRVVSDREIRFKPSIKSNQLEQEMAHGNAFASNGLTQEVPSLK